MSRPAPLSGIRVLDASRILAGPYCAQLLGDLGADVVKIERPGEGDDTRGWGPPFHREWSAYFLSCNRNKRSLTIDLHAKAGRDLFSRLLDKSDVLLENFRTDSLPKLGLEPQELLKRHQRLVVCSISGYGRTGPMKDALGYDFAIQALSGLMAITGEPGGTPLKVGVAVTDILTGLHGAVAILACLRSRETSGNGDAIDLSLLDSAIASQVNLAQAYLTSGNVPARQGNAHLQIVPYQSFQTANGWIVVNVGNDRQWGHFCDAIESPSLAAEVDFATNPRRVQNRSRLIPQLEAIMNTRPTAEWVERFERQQVPYAVVQDYSRLFEQEVTQARGMKRAVRDPNGDEVNLVGSPIHLEGTDLGDPRFPPRLGEHSAEVLRDWLGLSEEEIERLMGNQVI